MQLAQDTPVMLLDGPTTFLGISHQLEPLDLCSRLNRDDGSSIGMVLDDLNRAARFADHLIVMKDGQIEATGVPGDVPAEDLVARVLRLRSSAIPDHVFGTLMMVPVRSLDPSDSITPDGDSDA